MSKIKMFLMAALFVAGASQVQAQKSGYISVEQVVYLMPEVGKIDTALQKFQTDSLNAEFASLVQEYQYKDSILNKTDTSKIPVAVKRQHRQDLEQIAYQVQNWQQISQNVMQNKQQEMLAPVYQKVMKAINDVAKENNYSFVYNQEVLLVAPPSDNLLPLVAKKLNIKLPTQNAPQAANSGNSGARPAGNRRQ
ncbi:MAG TPA: OmpH family outer membrane protein [Flavisolibacter sp.]|jgi:outer membrane protein|nr:OmpH family outer membrane protein [Flavisolibacter sp.]